MPVSVNPCERRKQSRFVGLPQKDFCERWRAPPRGLHRLMLRQDKSRLRSRNAKRLSQAPAPARVSRFAAASPRSALLGIRPRGAPSISKNKKAPGQNNRGLGRTAFCARYAPRADHCGCPLRVWEIYSQLHKRQACKRVARMRHLGAGMSNFAGAKSPRLGDRAAIGGCGSRSVAGFGPARR